MREVFELYHRVSGGYPYMGLFLMSLLFLYIVFKKERELWFYPNVLVLLVLFNPFLMTFLNRYFLTGGIGTFWRIWWIIPVPFLIALMLTKILDYVKGKEKVIVTVLICIVIGMSGRFIFNYDNFYRTQNQFQIPNEIIHVSQFIMHDSAERGITEHNVVAVYDVAWRLRMYEPEIRMLFGRSPAGSRSGINSVEIAGIINSEWPDFEHVDSLLREDNVSYIVVDRQRLYTMPEYLARPDGLGYELIGYTHHYRVYRTNF
jgi:hypothetical protein